MSKDLKEHKEINLHMKKDTLVIIVLAIIISVGITIMKHMTSITDNKVPIWVFGVFVFVILLVYYAAIKGICEF